MTAGTRTPHSAIVHDAPEALKIQWVQRVRPPLQDPRTADEIIGHNAYGLAT